MPRLRAAQRPLDQNFELERNSPQAAGLINWWPLLHQGALLARDYAGGKNAVQTIASTGTATGWRGDPTVGQAYHFGTGNNANRLTATGPAFGDNNTIAFWTYFDGNPASNFGAFAFDATLGSRYLLYKNGSANAWGIFLNGVNLDDDATSFLNLIPQQAWTHVIIAWSRTQQRVYQNGQLHTSMSTSLGAAPTPTNLIIGNKHDASNVQWRGMHADFRVYNRMLSATEAYQLWAPQTRWELYRPAKRRTWVVLAGSQPVTVTPGVVAMSLALPAMTPTIRPTQGVVALAATLPASTPRLRSYPSAPALSVSSFAPTPRLRGLPGAVALTTALPAVTSRVRGYPGAVALSATLPAVRPTLQGTISMVALTLTLPDPTLTAPTQVSPDAIALAVAMLAPTPRLRVLGAGGTAGASLPLLLNPAVVSGQPPIALALTVPAVTAGPSQGIAVSAVALAMTLPAVTPSLRALPDAPALTTALPLVTPSLVGRPSSVDLLANVPSPSRLLRVSPSAPSLTVTAPTAVARLLGYPSAVALTLTTLSPLVTGTITASPSVVDLAVSALAPMARLRALPAPIALSLAMSAPRPTLRALPSAISLATALLAPSRTTRANLTPVLLVIAVPAVTATGDPIPEPPVVIVLAVVGIVSAETTADSAGGVRATVSADAPARRALVTVS